MWFRCIGILVIHAFNFLLPQRIDESEKFRFILLCHVVRELAVAPHLSFSSKWAVTDKQILGCPALQTMLLWWCGCSSLHASCANTMRGSISSILILMDLSVALVFFLFEVIWYYSNMHTQTRFSTIDCWYCQSDISLLKGFLYIVLSTAYKMQTSVLRICDLCTHVLGRVSAL